MVHPIIMNTSREQITNKATRLHWYHWVIVTGSFVLTFSAWLIASEQVKKQTSMLFDHQTKQIVALVREQMSKYEQALWAGVAAIEAIPGKAGVNHWRTFSESLSIETRYPGINGIGVIHYVARESLPDYLSWQRQLRPNYNIHPSHNESDYWPITYIEPEQINFKAVGLDMAHENNRFTAAKKARDNATPQITEPIVLVQDAKKTPGFLFFVPFYTHATPPATLELRREHFEGIVYAPFIMANLMSGTLQNRNRLVNFAIYDENYELYNELNTNSIDYDAKPLLTEDIFIEIYGRKWHFKVQSTTLFRAQQFNVQPLVVLIGGIIIDVVLFGLFFIFAGASRQAVSYADKVAVDLKNNENRLESTYNRLSCALESMLDGLLVISSKGIIQEANGAAIQLFAYPREELIGKNIKMLMPEQYSSQHDSYLSRYTDTGVKNIIGKERQLEGEKSDGTIFPLRLSVAEGQSQEGTFYTGVVHDMSSQAASERKLAEKQALLDVAMHSASTQFVLINQAGNVNEINISLCEWLGYTDETLIGSNFLDLTAQKYRQNFEHLLDHLFAGTQDSIRQELQFLRKDDSHAWGMLTASLIQRENGSRVCVANILDINKEKDLKDELLHRNAALEESNKELNQFAYIASHDLKEPLRTLRTFTGYLLKDIEKSHWQRVAEDVHYVEDAAKRMTQLVNDLLLLSRAANADLRKERVDIESLVKQVHSQLTTLIEERDAQIIIEGRACHTLGDRGQLGQLLQNLISNAIKFNRENITPVITIRYNMLPKNNARNAVVHIEVEDNGIGIDKEHLSIIFLAFKKLHSSDVYSGTGMGLSIVKKIVDRHYGRISVTSTEGQGSCFSIELPVEGGDRDVALSSEITRDN